MWLNSSCVECDTRSVYSTSHSYWHVDRYASARSDTATRSASGSRR